MDIATRRASGLNTPVLTHLSIRHLTLVDELELTFSPGMSVVTGETGAGKSIMLAALGLTLGNRADSSLVAPGADRAEINTGFDVSDNTDALAWLDQKALREGDTCILRRIVHKDGRSRAFINGSAITLTELRELSEMLLDIHSQHEHQSLLKKESHRKLLDEYGGLTGLAEQVGELFATISSLDDQLERIKAAADGRSARIQLLNYQAEELVTLAVSGEETPGLEAEQKRLNSADVTLGKLAEVIRLCDRENDQGASSQTSRALSLLETIDDDESIAPIRELLGESLIQMDEAMRDLSSMLNKFEANPARLTEVEGRLGAIYEVARKHRVSPDDLPALAERMKKELDDLVNVDEQVGSLKAEAREARKHYDALAGKLSAARGETAQLLASEVSTQLQGLGMEGAVFRIFIEPSEDPARHGRDDIEFLISTIPGNEPGPLARIASGGELSRISLAIQVTAAGAANTPTLVFDEVDVGVGGATAEVIGKLLRRLGADAQVICVTHLPQVAAQGHRHYVVNKSTGPDGASTSARELSEEEKIAEIARMLGGIEKTDQSLAHAASMLAGAGP